MPALNFVDRYTSTLSGSYTSGGTSLSVTSAAGLPSGACNFYLIVQAEGANTEEVCHVTDVTGTTLTVVGAQSGSAASDHASGAVVIGSIMTAAAWNSVRADISKLGTFSTLPATGMVAGDRYRQTDGPYEFVHNGSVWVPTIGGQPALTLPPAADWTWDNQGSSTTDNSHGYEISRFLNATATQLRFRYRTAPATSYVITALLDFDLTGGLVSSTGNEVGLLFGFRDGDGKFVVWMLQLTGGVLKIGTVKWTSSTSFSAYYTVVTTSLESVRTAVIHHPLWLRVADNGTNLVFSYSINGIDWTQFDSQARTNWFASGPTQYGYGAYVGDNNVTVSLLSISES